MFLLKHEDLIRFLVVHDNKLGSVLLGRQIKTFKSITMLLEKLYRHLISKKNPQVM